MFKYGGEGLLRKLHDLILAVWEAEAVPKDWKDSIIISIYKNKGDSSEFRNSRGIFLLSVAGKLLAKILRKRLIKDV